MPQTFLLNKEGDIEFDGQNNIKLVDGTDELIQRVTIALQTNLKEWFLNPAEGFDRKTVQKKRFNDEEIRGATAETLQQIEEITTIEEISINFDRPNRTININFRASTTEGEIESEVGLVV